MIALEHRLSREQRAAVAVTDTLTLPFDRRCRSRQRVRLDSGTEAAVVLPRGILMRDGDLLTDADGRHCVRVAAATETLSEVAATDARTLARAAYHLGNRHVALQIGHHWLRYRHDHVLDGMIAGLGLEVRAVQAAFEPEEGAYGGHRHDQ